MRSVRPGKTTTVKRNNTDLQPVLQFVFIAWPYSCRNFTPLVLQLPMLFTFERTDDIERFVNATHFTSYSWRKVCNLFAPSNDTTKIPSKRLTTPLGFQNDRSRIFFFLSTYSSSPILLKTLSTTRIHVGEEKTIVHS